MKPLTFNWTVGKAAEGKTLRDYLLRDKMISRQALTDIKYKGGALYVNGVPVTVRYRVMEADRLTVCFPPEDVSEYMQPLEMPLSILYEDEHFLAVDKPADLPTIPSRIWNTKSLAQGILYYYQQQQIPSTIHAVNRLDRDTSGIVLFAKHRYGHSLMSKQQISGQMNRSYVALCYGLPQPTSGTIDEPIGRKEGSIIERCVRHDGQSSITHYEVLQNLNDYAYLSLKLETGRTHQIRVHMSYRGHPLLGDTLYGGSAEMMDRQALHSRFLEFYHPFKEEMVKIEAPLPEDMDVLIK